MGISVAFLVGEETKKSLINTNFQSNEAFLVASILFVIQIVMAIYFGGSVYLLLNYFRANINYDNNRNPELHNSGIECTTFDYVPLALTPHNNYTEIL